MLLLAGTHLVRAEFAADWPAEATVTRRNIAAEGAADRTEGYPMLYIADRFTLCDRACRSVVVRES